DVGVIERGQQLGLALEAGELLGVARQLGRQRLDRHLAIELAVVGEVHDAHAAAAEFTFDDVVAERLGRYVNRAWGVSRIHEPWRFGDVLSSVTPVTTPLFNATNGKNASPAGRSGLARDDLTIS